MCSHRCLDSLGSVDDPELRFKARLIHFTSKEEPVALLRNLLKASVLLAMPIARGSQVWRALGLGYTLCPS